MLNILYYVCHTNVAYTASIIGSRGDTYTVQYGYQTDGYTCGCTGYLYRRRCKHIEQVRQIRCGWNQYLDGGAPVIDSNGRLQCPKCRGAITTVKAHSGYFLSENT